MRLVSYERDGAWRCGIETGETVVDAAEAARRMGLASDGDADALHSTRALLALGSDAVRSLCDEVGAAENGAGLARENLRLGPPVWDPPKIVCLGLNYRDHAEEAGLQPPSAPMFFAKWANSLIGPEDSIVPPPTARQVDYEAELAVVIGTRGRDIAAEQASEYIAGAMAFNDVSARDLQLANPLWTGGKAIDTFAPCGPALVTADAFGDIQSLAVRTRVNGTTVQDGTTAAMVFSVAETIAYLSRIMTLEVGDIIATGTPAGVGNSRDPKLFLQPGDLVEVEVEGIGTLRNPVAPRR